MESGRNAEYKGNKLRDVVENGKKRGKRRKLQIENCNKFVEM